VKRKLIILAAAASLTCLVGSAVLWSFPATRAGVAVGWRWYRDSSHPICGIYLHSERGGPEQVWYVRRFVPLAMDDLDVVESHRPSSLLGFPLIGYYATRTDRYYAAGVPFWFLAVTSGVACYVCGRSLLRRYPLGHCGKCGYDLRASKDRCSECGEAIPQKVRA
jgi:hypothetical protein